MKLQIANMPRFPSTSRKSWPIGKGKSVVRSEETDFVAKDATTSSSHPRISVIATPRMMAIGALRCAPATSSEMCAAESSDTYQKSFRSRRRTLTACQRPHWRCKRQQECPSI